MQATLATRLLQFKVYPTPTRDRSIDVQLSSLYGCFYKEEAENGKRNTIRRKHAEEMP